MKKADAGGGGGGSGDDDDDDDDDEITRGGKGKSGGDGNGNDGLSPNAAARDGGQLRKRRSLGEGSSGDMSTDSEWDKVEEAGEIAR